MLRRRDKRLSLNRFELESRCLLEEDRKIKGSLPFSFQFPPPATSRLAFLSTKESSCFPESRIGNSASPSLPKFSVVVETAQQAISKALHSCVIPVSTSQVSSGNLLLIATGNQFPEKKHIRAKPISDLRLGLVISNSSLKSRAR